MTEEIKEEDIKVSEEKDGSVTVEMPEHLLASETEEEAQEAPKMAEGGQVEEDDQDHPDDTDAVREARRARRKAKKEYIKRVQTEKDERLAAQERRIQELQERLVAMEQESKVDKAAKLEKAIQDAEARINFAKIRLKEATERADGTALVSAQEMYHDAKDQLDRLNNYKAQVQQHVKAQEVNSNPMVQRHADRWLKENSWYDPDGGDDRSRLAKKIDQQLAREGWNPSSREYWTELTARLQEEESSAYTDPIDETPRKRGPRSVVTGSERETGGGSSRNTFTLSAEQVRAMKEAGFWDDKAKRARMIQKYAEQARQTRS